MTASTVYFTNLRGQMGYNLLDKTRKLFGHSGFAEKISPGDKVAVKLHFGEEGNTAFLPPMFARVVVEEIKKAGGKPFLIDTNTLYKGSRGKQSVVSMDDPYWQDFMQKNYRHQDVYKIPSGMAWDHHPRGIIDEIVDSKQLERKQQMFANM